MKAAARQPGYMSQLDAVRFFAVMGVIVHHNWKPGSGTWIFGTLDWGDLGVRLFFVLSGFLITGILLGGRELGQRDPERRLFFIRQFYVRRFLRIFPIYYLVLIVLAAVGVGALLQIWPWLFTYSTNIYVWHHLVFPEWVGHFWTLAVEEQFYLVWPWLMLFLPRRWLVPVLLGLICLAPLYRLIASFYYTADISPGGGFASFTFTAAALDSLGLGALLAIWAHADPGRKHLDWVLSRIVLPIGALTFATLWIVAHHGHGYRAYVVLSDTAASLVFCWLVGTASRGFRGAFGSVLDWSPIIYLGKISYGIYIFHNIVPFIFAAIAVRIGVNYEDAGIVNFILTSLATFGIAALSWRCFEGPINGLKRYFPYDPERKAHPVTSVAPAGEAPAAAS
jgi:peptidoglycan/LPS O-acetylase OafA/YrhL